MKPLYLLSVILLIATVSCNKEDSNKPWDPNAMVSLRPAAGVKAADDGIHLTASEIVRQAVNIKFYNDLYSDGYIGRGFADHQRDLVNNRLLMYGTDIIDQDGIYTDIFIEAYDVVLERIVEGKLDTIGYIPKSVLRTAELAIKAAYAKQDYEACYKIFDEAFTFIPITGKEWRNLTAH